MKTRNILAACTIAVFCFGAINATAQEAPSIKVYPSGEILKVVFGYDSKTPVLIDFFDNSGNFGSDKVSGMSKGFLKRYRVKRDNQSTYWVSVQNDLVAARFRISTNDEGKVESELETVTYNNPIAKR